MVEYIALAAIGGFCASLPFWRGKRKLVQQERHERYLWCSNCEAHLNGHHFGSLECPARWWNEKTQAMTKIHFFKPLTMEEWMKREGLA